MATTNRIAPADRPALPNGHAARHVNGRAKESAPSESTPQDSAKQDRARAASDDGHEASSGASNAAAIPPAASTDRDAFADAARASSANSEKETAANLPGRDAAKNPAETSQKSNAKDPAKAGAKPGADKPHVPVPAGELPLPEEAGAFVNAVHEQADIIEVGRRLLNSRDEKIVKGVWDRLVNLKFGDTDQTSDANSEGLSIEGAPRPIRNKPQQSPEHGTEFAATNFS